MDTCICMAESLCCPPETIITLLIDYISIQNKKLKKKKRILQRKRNYPWFISRREARLQWRRNSYYSYDFFLRSQVPFCLVHLGPQNTALPTDAFLFLLFFRKLSKVLNFYVANADDSSKTELLFAALKALKYLFRFIIQSRVLYLR